MSVTDEKMAKCETKLNPDRSHKTGNWVAWLPKSRFATNGAYSFSAPDGSTFEDHELTVNVSPDIENPEWSRIEGPSQRSVSQALYSILLKK